LAIICFSLVTIGANAQNDELSKADKYYELHAFKQAIPYYLSVLKSNDSDTRTVSRLADAYQKTGNLKESAYWYARIADRKDRNPEDLLKYAQVLKSQGLYPQAKSWFNAYARYNPEVGSHFAKSCDYALQNKTKVPGAIYNERVNTASSEFGPAFFKDKVVFSSFRKDKIPAGSVDELNKDSYNGLFISPKYGSGRLHPPLLLKTEYKLETNQCYVAYDASGKTVAFVKNDNNFTDGVLPLPETGVKMDIYFASVKGESTWEDETAFTYNGIRYSTSYPFLSADGKKLYFASDIPGGFGGFDLYESTRIGNNWSEPRNLGSRVNTSGNEISPFVTKGKLFFASDYHTGFGGMDIFEAQMVEGVWAQVTNLGYGVNTSYDDLDFIYNSAKKGGYLSSNRPGGKGRHDIYYYAFTRSLDESPMVAGGGVPEVDPTQVMYTGRVINSETEEPLSGIDIKAHNKNTGTVIKAVSDQNGAYEIALKEDMTYRMVFSKAGFLNKYRTVEVTPTASKGFLKTTEIEPSPLTTSTEPGVALFDDSGLKEAINDDLEITENDFGKSSVDQGGSPSSLSSKSNNDGLNQMVTVYDVQVGVYSKPNPDKLAPLSAIGDVHTENRGNLKAVKIGPFATRAEAEVAQKAAKDRGFTGAFIKTSQQNAVMRDLAMGSGKASDEPQPKAVSTSSGSKDPIEDIVFTEGSANDLVAASGVVFKVQLGAYRDANAVEFDQRLLNWGDAQKESLNNGLTRLMLGDFSSKKSADSAKLKAIEYGFNGAYVVAYKNGKKIPLSEALTQ
ncbi:MAG: carboxypeptidase regulatory-like domain-containing protein, partial [Bacteroidota bacterium]